MTETIRVHASGPLSEHDIQGLSDVLIDCVEGGASVSFMLPISRAKADAFWHDVAGSVARGERAVLIAQDISGEIVGTVQVVLATAENQPHRADVAKMLVKRAARKAGLGARLLHAAGSFPTMPCGRTGAPAIRRSSTSHWPH